VAADAVGDVLIDRPVRLLHKIGVDDAEHLAAIVRRLALTDDVHFLVVPAEMDAIRTFDAGAGHADDLVGLAVIFVHAAEARAGEVGVAVVGAERDPDRVGILQRDLADHAPVLGADPHHGIIDVVTRHAGPTLAG